MSLSSLGQLLNAEYIGGNRGEWYYHVKVGGLVLQGGYFYRKADARRHMKVALAKVFSDPSVTKEFFKMRHGR